MIKQPTVIVLGAGASKPYGFPTGHELLVQLARSATYTFDGREAQHLPEHARGELDDFRTALRGAQPESIDSFLADRQDLLIIGKLCLANALIGYEDPEKLQDLESPGHWMREVWLSMKAPPDKFADNRISFVTYNYDRSIEHYLTTALANAYRIMPEAAWSHVKRLKIIHPHGMLGRYRPDGGGSAEVNSRPYRRATDTRAENAARNEIHLFWERDNALTSAELAEVFAEAKMVVFLGFGFLDSNLAHLLPLIEKGARDGLFQTWGTGLGLTKHREAAVRESLFSRTRALYPVDCLTLLREHVELR